MRKYYLWFSVIPAIIAIFALRHVRDEYSLLEAYIVYYFIWWIPLLVAVLIEKKGRLPFPEWVKFRHILGFLLLSPVLCGAFPLCIIGPWMALNKSNSGVCVSNPVAAFCCCFSGVVPAIMLLGGILSVLAD